MTDKRVVLMVFAFVLSSSVGVDWGSAAASQLQAVSAGPSSQPVGSEETTGSLEATGPKEAKNAGPEPEAPESGFSSTKFRIAFESETSCGAVDKAPAPSCDKYSISPIDRGAWASSAGITLFVFACLVGASVRLRTRPTEELRTDLEKEWGISKPDSYSKPVDYYETIRPLREYVARLTTHTEGVFHMRLNYFLLGEAFLFAALFTISYEGTVPNIARLLPILGHFATYSYWVAIVRAEDRLVLFQDVLDELCVLYKSHPRGGEPIRFDWFHERLIDWFHKLLKFRWFHKLLKSFLDKWLKKSYLFITWLTPAVFLWAWLIVLWLFLGGPASYQYWFWIFTMVAFVLTFTVSACWPPKPNKAG